MDDMDMESEELGGNAKFFVGEYAKYSWRKVYNKTRGGQEILVDYSAALTAMSNNSDLPSIFHTIFKQAYLPYNDPETLKEFLKQINLFDYDHSEKLGDAFEYLLSVLGSQGDAGQFRTPRHIIDFMVDVVEPKKNETILDPACGTAGFLISAYKYILATNSGEENQLTPDERKQLSENIVGYDISPDMVRLSLVNMYLHRLTNPKISEYDTLTSDAKWGEYFDVILANPPFMSPKGGIKPHSRFSVQSKRSEALFVDYIAEHLTHTGRGAVIVPEGVIFKSDAAFKKLRKMLVEENYLYGVISLPSGVFNPYSGVKTSILLFDKCVARQTDKLIFAKVENDGFALGAQRRPIEGSQLPAITSMIKAFRTAVIDGKEFESDSCTLVEKSKIAESGDYNLSGERYVENASRSTNCIYVSLGDKSIFEIVSGGTPDSKNNSYWNGDINWATLVDLPASNFITNLTSTERTITEEGLKSSSAKLLPQNSILVSTRATIGRVAINKVETATNQGFKNIIIKDNEVADYNYVALMMTYLRPQMDSLAIGGTFKEISKSNFCTLEIPLPSIEEQKAIVAEIESCQKIIDAARTIVNNYRPQITIDPEWEMVELGEVCDIKSGGTPSRNELSYWNGDIPWVGSGVCKDTVISSANEFITSAGLSNSSAKLFPKGTTLIALVGATIGKTALLNFESTTNQNVAGLQSKDNNILLTNYLFYISQSLYSEFLKVGDGKFRMANLSFVRSLQISLPPIETQKQIVAEIEREQKAVESAKELMEIFEQKIKNRIAKIWGE